MVNLQSKGQFQHIAESNQKSEGNEEILTYAEIAIVKAAWKHVKRFKVELEDMLQEGRLAKYLGEDVRGHMDQYVQAWRGDVLSDARSIDRFPAD